MSDDKEKLADVIALPKKGRIVQMACAHDDLFVLDDQNRVWIWDEERDRWDPLPELPL